MFYFGRHIFLLALLVRGRVDMHQLSEVLSNGHVAQTGEDVRLGSLRSRQQQTTSSADATLSTADTTLSKTSLGDPKPVEIAPGLMKMPIPGLNPSAAKYPTTLVIVLIYVLFCT